MITPTPEQPDVTLTIDGQQVTVPAGSTIWEAARDAGIDIPVLCHSDGMDPVGVCRLCVVDVGERVLAPSCMRECQPDMTVDASSQKVEKHRKVLTELLLSEHPVPCARELSSEDCELEALGRQYELLPDNLSPDADGDGASCVGAAERFEPAAAKLNDHEDRAGWRSFDGSSPVIAVDHQACILCDRCVRACDDIQSNDVIGRSGKGFASQIAFDLSNPMGESTCVSCGECVSSCPTGALVQQQITLPVIPSDEKIGRASCRERV